MIYKENQNKKMATVKKNILTACFNVSEESKVVYSAGKYFEINESNVKIIPTTGILEELEYALKNFNVSENGMSFYYDLNSKSIKRVVEGVTTKEFQIEQINKSVDAFNKIEDLNEKLGELETLRKSHKLAGNEVAVNEAMVLVSDIKSNIATLKESARTIVYSYNAKENQVYVNNRKVSPDSLAENMFASGLINYSDKTILNIFENVVKHFNKFAVAESLVEIVDGTTTTSVIRHNSNAIVFKNNTANKITEFNSFSALKTIEYLEEKTGEDVSFMFNDILEAKSKLQEKIDSKIEETRELISFLKDQRNILADANKNIPEIKEADNLIRTEISNFEQVISILKEDELTRNDGFTNASLAMEYDGHAKGTDVKVDALDYTTAGKDDMITVVIDDKPVKVMKRHVNIEASETV